MVFLYFVMHLFVTLMLGNLKHLPFVGLGEKWDTYEDRFEEALTWLRVSRYF